MEPVSSRAAPFGDEAKSFLTPRLLFAYHLIHRDNQIQTTFLECDNNSQNLPFSLDYAYSAKLFGLRTLRSPTQLLSLHSLHLTP